MDSYEPKRSTAVRAAAQPKKKLGIAWNVNDESSPKIWVLQRDAVHPEVFGKNRKRFGNCTHRYTAMQKIGINLALFGKLAKNEWILKNRHITLCAPRLG